jgi:hypothetical protein
VPKQRTEEINQPTGQKATRFLPFNGSDVTISRYRVSDNARGQI